MANFIIPIPTLPASGGTMLGSISLASGASIINLSSGTNSLGSESNPFNTIYVDHILSTGSAGDFVNTTGDTMTGNLVMQSPAMVVTEFVSGTNLSLLGQSISATTTDNIIFTVGATLGDRFDIIKGTESNSPAFRVGSTATTFRQNSVLFAYTGTQVTPTTSGTVLIGTADLPFSGVFTKNLAVTNITGLSPINVQSQLIVQANIGISGSAEQGLASLAIGDYSHTEGNSTISSGNYSHAEGQGNVSYSQASHAEGVSTVSSGLYSHAEGQGTLTFGQASHSEGVSTISHEGFSHAEGQGSQSYGSASHAEGLLAVASGQHSHAEGNANVTYAGFSHAEGQTTAAWGSASHSEGILTVASGSFSHAEGQSSVTTSQGSHAEGLLAAANGQFSHAEGNAAATHQSFSHAEGQLTNVYGQAAHSEGNATVASGIYSHAEGQASSTVGQASHAEGLLAITNGDYSHGEGNASATFGNFSHAEGQLTKSYGQASHSEGNSAVASGIYSHAEGQETVTHGQAAHAEGVSTIAYGDYSHVQGNQSVASGNFSFAGGQFAQANGYVSVALAGWSGSANASGSWILRDANQDVDISNDIDNSLLLGFSGGVHLSSGTDILNTASGINNLGSFSNPFSGIYAKTVYATNITGMSPINVLSDIVLSANILRADSNPFTISGNSAVEITASNLTFKEYVSGNTIFSVSPSSLQLNSYDTTNNLNHTALALADNGLTFYGYESDYGNFTRLFIDNDNFTINGFDSANNNSYQKTNFQADNASFNGYKAGYGTYTRLQVNDSSFNINGFDTATNNNHQSLGISDSSFNLNGYKSGYGSYTRISVDDNNIGFNNFDTANNNAHTILSLSDSSVSINGYAAGFGTSTRLSINDANASIVGVESGSSHNFVTLGDSGFALYDYISASGSATIIEGTRTLSQLHSVETKFDGNIIANSSGTQAIGSIAAPFSGVYANTVNESAITITENYSGTATDTYIFCNQSAPIQIDLPVTSAGKKYIIKDISGSASSNTIFVSGIGATIEGVSILTIAFDRASAIIVSDGLNYHAINGLQ